MTRQALLVAIMALFTVSCKPPTGAIVSGEYSNTHFGLSVRALDRVLMPDTWTVENFYYHDGEWKPRNRETLRLKLDVDGDGSRETSLTVEDHLLRFAHTRSLAVIALRAIPVSRDIAKRSLASIVQSYIEDISSGGVEVVWHDGGSATVRERPYSAEILHESSGQLAGLPAHVAEIDVVDRNQVKSNPTHHFRTLEVVLAYLPHELLAVDIARPQRKSDPTVPVILLASHSNTPAAFESTHAEFTAFLDRIRIDGRSGFSVEASPEPAALIAPSASTLKAAPL